MKKLSRRQVRKIFAAEERRERQHERRRLKLPNRPRRIPKVYRYLEALDAD